MDGLSFLSEFTSLIQLSATLNIAFVAVEYAKSFAHAISTQVFKFHILIKTTFDNTKDLIVDQTTLDAIVPIDINGISTSMQIEDVRRRMEILKEEIDSSESNLFLL
jgi:hypothetical protein